MVILSVTEVHAPIVTRFYFEVYDLIIYANKNKNYNCNNNHNNENETFIINLLHE